MTVLKGCVERWKKIYIKEINLYIQVTHNSINKKSINFKPLEIDQLKIRQDTQRIILIITVNHTPTGVFQLNAAELQTNLTFWTTNFKLILQNAPYTVQIWNESNILFTYSQKVKWRR